MPETINVMYWNVQDLGCFKPYERGDFTAINNFIAKLSVLHEVDVICLIESRKQYVAELPNLMNALDDAAKRAGRTANWWYDWIPGAIKGDLHTVFDEDLEEDTLVQRVKRRRAVKSNRVQRTRKTPTKFEQLDYTVTGHYEGYVVLWNDAATSFSMVKRDDGCSGGILADLDDDPEDYHHAINLVFEGRGITGKENIPGKQQTHWLLEAYGFNPALPGGFTLWEQLEFCERAFTSGYWYAVRRPAYCTIKIAHEPDDKNAYLPIIMAHTPSKESSGAFGSTNRAALARQMYMAQKQDGSWVNANRAVIGGDWNVSTQHDYSYVFNAYTRDRGAAMTSGAGATQFVPARTGMGEDATLSKSIVRVKKPTGNGTRKYEQIVPDRPSDDANSLYRSLAVDNLFYRNFTAAPPKPNNEVYNLQVELQTANSDVAKAAKRCFYRFIRNKTKGKKRNADGNPLKWRYSLCYPNVLEFDEMMTQLKNKHFTSPRRTAEFINTFLSDHLPLIVKLTTT